MKAQALSLPVLALAMCLLQRPPASAQPSPTAADAASSAAASPEISCPQRPPALPGASAAPGRYSAVSGPVSQFNFGPDMEITSFFLGANILVTFPSHAQRALSSALKLGDTVQVSGYSSPTAAGLQRIDLLCLVARGKRFLLPKPDQDVPYKASGAVSQWNYNRDGEIDGFLFGKGILARTPPNAAASLRQDVAVGENVTVVGLARQTLEGEVVINVQSINGHPISQPKEGAAAASVTVVPASPEKPKDEGVQVTFPKPENSEPPQPPEDERLPPLPGNY